MVLHYYGHGYSDATRQTMPRNQVVERSFLAPQRRSQILGRRNFRHNPVSVVAVCRMRHLVPVNILKYLNSSGRHIVRIKSVVIRISYHRRDIVRSGYNDKTVAVDAIEHIERRRSGTVNFRMGQLQF